LLDPSQRLFFEPEIDFLQFGSAGGPERIVNAFERDSLTVFNQPWRHTDISVSSKFVVIVFRFPANCRSFSPAPAFSVDRAEA
jgi:hypothetical protein